MKQFASRKTQLGWICAACTALVLLAEIADLSGSRFSPIGRWEWRLRDFLTRLGRTAPVDSRLVFLGIDDASVSLEPVDFETLFADIPRDSADFRALELMAAQWPWSREVHALVLEKLIAAGASVVAFDLLFPKPQNDDAFRAALDRHAGRVVVGSNFVAQSGADGHQTWTQAFPTDTLIPQTTPVDPRVGFVNFWPDERDSIIRRARLRQTAEALHGWQPGPNSEVFLSFGARSLIAAGLADLVPPAVDEVHLFRFSGPPDFSFPPASIYQIFVPKYWAANFGNGERLRGKIVVIGPSGNWQHDVHPTPFGPMPGPEIHLNAMNALLQRELLREAPRWVDLSLIVLAGCGAWCIAFFTSRSLMEVLRIFAANAFLLLVTLASFQFLDCWVAITAPLLALNLSGGACFVFEAIHEQLEKARTRHMLERYVGKDVVHELLDQRESLLHSLGGQRKFITVLFSDLRGFTTLTEDADAVSLVSQLNEYFNRMVRCVFSSSGTLDKFIGDGLMAHWGSIVSGGEAEDARGAVRAALEMRRGLAELNEDWAARGWPRLQLGIGINSGEAIVGNVGCEEKMEVSVIGDPVNLASRIESATKQFQLDFLIGEEVARRVRDTFLLRTVDLLQVKGKSRPVEVFTVLAELSPSATAPAWLAPYEEGVRLYRHREFSAALRCFGAAAETNLEDWLIGEYRRRCENYLATPPDQSWSGVYVLTKK